jgi:hypothetical protein
MGRTRAELGQAHVCTETQDQRGAHRAKERPRSLAQAWPRLGRGRAPSASSLAQLWHVGNINARGWRCGVRRGIFPP